MGEKLEKMENIGLSIKKKKMLNTCSWTPFNLNNGHTIFITIN